jgi:hypothetical protein
MVDLNLDSIYKYKNELIMFSNITEIQIRDIWYTKGEEYLTEFDKLEYFWNIPLYQKMIFRYRNGNNLATTLYQGCDPCNQRRLLGYFRMFYSDVYEVIEFLRWIANYLMVIDILELEGLEYNETNVNNSELIKQWKANNITFFFSLTKDQQRNLLKKYIEEIFR